MADLTGRPVKYFYLKDVVYSSIQIIGTQRSGSNLLRLILNQFPQISAPHPPHVLKTFVPLLPYYGNLQEDDNFYLLAHDIASFVNANPVPWNEKPLKANDLLAVARSRNLLGLYEGLYTLRAKHDGARIWCCKSMFNEYYTEEMEKGGLMPFYIHLYRDGRDVAVSFKQALIGPKHVYHIAKKWLADQQRALKVGEMAGSARFYSLSYESLISDPETELKKLSDKLGLKYFPGLLSYYLSDESQRTASSGEMWRNVNKPIIKNNIGKFHHDLTPNEIAVFEKVAGSMLERLGYKPETPIDAINAIITPEEIEKYDQQNELLQKQALLHASPLDIAKRNRQEEVVREIKQRFGLL